MTSRRRSRARRVLGVIGGVVGATVTFVAATAAGAVLHLDVPATRRLVTTQVNGILEKQLKGDVKIESLGGLGLGGIDRVRVRVKDPDGVQVLYADGVKVRIRSLEAARSALFGKGDIRISAPIVSIDHADVALDTDPMGALRLSRAFLPKETKAQEPPKKEGGRGVRIEAPDVVLRHAWAHGAPSPGGPVIDADVKDLAGHALVDSAGTRAGLDRVEIVTRALPAGVDPKGRLTASYEQASAEGSKPRIAATFDGKVMDAPAGIVAKMDGDRIDATVDVQSVSAAQVGAALGELPVRDELSLHAEAHGTLPHVKGGARIALGQATVDVDADVTTGDATAIDARLSARDVDLSRIAKGAPESNLGLDARANAVLGEAMSGRVEIDTLPENTIGAEHVPRVVVRGDFTKETAQATARIHEATLPTEVRVSMTPERGDRIVEAHVRSVAPDLRRLPRVSGALDSGSAEVVADARLALAAKTIDARVAVTGRRVAKGAQAVADVHAEARATGSLDRPVIDAAVVAEDVRAGGIDARRIEGRSRVEAGKAIVLRDPRVDVERAGEKIAVSAARVQAAGASIRVEDARIEGLGEPIRAELARDPRTTTVKVAAPRVDLAKVSRVIGRDVGVSGGTLALGADVTLKANDATGEVHAKLERFSMKSVENANVALDVALDGRALQVDVDAQLDAAGKLSLHSERLTLAGSPTDPRSWAKASGRVALAGDVDMAKLSSIVPEESLPFGELRGELVVDGTIGRDSPTSPPELRVHAHTLGLVVAGKVPPEEPIPKRPQETEVKGVSPWRSDDVDVGLDIRNDTTSGHTGVAFRVTDREGVVTAFDAKSVIPYEEILADPKTAKAKLLRVPIAAKLIVPDRAFDRMPAIVGVKNTSGKVEAQIDVTGTPIAPNVKLVAHARGVRSGTVPVQQAADTDVALAYDGNAADLAVKVRAEKRDVLEIASHVDAKLADILEGAPGKAPAWTASSKVKLAGFPLESVGPLADRQVKGRVSGEATIEGLHQNAKLAAHIGFDGLSVGRAKYEKARIDVDAADGGLTAKARFEQKDGFADVTATTGLAWGAAVAPALAEDKPIEARFVAKGFRAAAIQPFVEGTLNALDGRIDADARASISPANKGARLEGKIALRDGTLQLAAMGEELRDARANVTLNPNGTIAIDDVFARSASGEVHADAKVELAGMRLARATANVRIPERHGLDVAVNGQPLGEVFGEIKADARMSEDGKRTAVVVEIPKFSVTLPQTTKTGVQGLDENERIRVGVYRDPNTLVKLPLDREDYKRRDEEKQKAEAAADGSRTEVDVRLGRIEVERGNMARATLTGNPKITIANGETRITGQVRVERGWADVQGKKFEIEKGTITFNGLPEPNPVVVATASWKAADNSMIYADFVGPVKTGKVTLRSEPPRPKNEILAMILFGSADGANPTPPPAGKQPNGTQKAALGIGGGFAAQGLTEALDDLAGIQATARIDTTSSNNPRPEVEFQVSPKVSLEFAHVIGQPPVTEPPDKNLVTIEWRFRSNWSLESTFGDRGRQLFDLIWQRRY